ncbi:(-)-germacrene D synthase [Vitis vinifera]|nr:(-)-germacrene D synthase [Vitis vinifera]|eukprot:XP_019072461.1 PREDICTED: (-)-germacrene D synthase [Vitis vinifera]
MSSFPLSITQKADPKLARNTANFVPNFWGDCFLTYIPDDTVTHACKEKELEGLKEEVRNELKATAGKSSQLLNFIDSIQRLGLAYHFEREIEDALKVMYETYNLVDDDNDDLASAALRFRLLRQEGYHIPSDVFKKFKDEEGNFKESLVGDLPGMLALYEATHLMVHGEDILDEAQAFTTAHLQSMAPDSDNPLKKQVIHALERPIRKSLIRVEARHYISIYQEYDSHNKSLLKLAKLDFNLLQSLHRKELSEITKWWKGLDFATKLPFARDRIVEGYFWVLGVYFEPQYFLARRILLKVFAMTSIIDDIYDTHGTFEELKLFAEAIERWDASSIDQLPDYMKLCYQALLDVFEEIEEEMTKQEKPYRVHYAKQAMKKLVQAYFVEAKWLKQEYIPTIEEYMTNALVSCGYFQLATISFVGMGDMVTKKAFDWVFSDPKMVRASAIICRLMDDIVDHEFEQKRGYVVSGVQCYMKQYGVTEQEACEEFINEIMNAWKDMNEECLKRTQVPMPLLTCVVNFARVIDLLYKNQDEYTHVGKLMKDLIAWMLIDPVPM